ncbi:hypothetical protein FSP39_019278 [Pinctada imbricata]|uniref:ferroxidase n=1 Tax=Pinctada imbricata TaxID=66713 RepID=A0AA88Y4N3_PINIB|nr:hypothetical protein FSP39_019278 [Pinctada imbricata]
MKWKSMKTFKEFSTSKQLYHPELSSNDYEVVADETLDSLTEFFEDLPERLRCDEEYDTSYGSGVLTVKISNKWGTYVINKQTPNKQVWLSSPKSGPKRYDFMEGTWIYKHDGKTLHQVLTEEISEAMGTEIDCTKCAYGKQDTS